MKENYQSKKRVEREPLSVSIAEAVDQLSKISEFDVHSQKKAFAESKRLFKIVHQYLEHVYKQEKQALKNQATQKGIQALMHLVEEAAKKLNIDPPLFKRGEKNQVAHIQEYKTLKTFYQEKILRAFEDSFSSEFEWEELSMTMNKGIDTEKNGIQDLEMVKGDKNYELFYLRKEDERPFFNKNLLRHIKLVSDFDEMIKGFAEDDPLLKMSAIFDHEAQEVAKEIYEKVGAALKHFYPTALSHKDLPLVSSMLKITMSLMLACNAQNRVENGAGKVCTHYFEDFHKFLREFFQSIDYQSVMQDSIQEVDPLTRNLIDLAHALAFAFFNHSRRKKEFLDYFKRFIQTLDTKLIPKTDPMTTDMLIDQLFETHLSASRRLKTFPNGPLFKALDALQNWKTKNGFDPINQGNLPHLLYYFSNRRLKTSCLKMACPTSQIYIHQAEIVEEFQGFLRNFERKNRSSCHLHFNLQDRTSWQEHARCVSLEKLQKKAEFSKQFVLVTLPSRDRLYDESIDDLKSVRSQDFLKRLEESIQEPDNSGFFFSNQIDKETLLKGIKKIILMIHKIFFEKTDKLSPREQRSFIEIFYLFLELKIIDMIQPLTFTFSCKDAIDVGATASAAFFVFLKLLGNNTAWTKEEQEHLLWILYNPALTVRERLVHEETFNRFADALKSLSSAFNKDLSHILNPLKALFSPSFFENIQISWKF